VNPIERVIRRVDKAQQRHTVSAFVVGVVKKYGDDNGGVLAGSLAHSAFVAVFPLLLVLVTILGFILSGHPALRLQVLHAVEGHFPAIGNQLAGNVHALRRSSVIGLVVGLLGLTWGASGLAQACLFTMQEVWNLPGPARIGYVPRLGRAMLFLGILGGSVIITTLLASLDTFGHHAVIIVVLAQVLAALTNVGLYLCSFRVLTPKGVPSRALFPGAATGGLAWTGLQAAGTYLVHHFLRSDSVYGVFATVLGLVAWLYLAVQLTLYSAEINVVLSRRLWPRSIVQPPLTEADRSSIALQALQSQRREEEHIEVSFDDRPSGTEAPGRTPQRPQDVSPPARHASEDRQGLAEQGTAPARSEDRQGPAEQGTAPARSEDRQGPAEQGTAPARSEDRQGPAEQGTAPARSEDRE
jgi:YihY family inner membrane protein